MSVRALDPPGDADRAAWHFTQPPEADAPAHCGALIWHCARTLARYAERPDRLDATGHPVLTPVMSARLLADARRWRGLFADLATRGGLLVMIAGPTTSVGVHTLQEVVEFDAGEIVPGGLQVRAPAARSPLRATCGAPFRALVQTVIAQAPAAQELALPGGIALAVDAAGRCVAGYRYLHPGHLLVLPESALAAPVLHEAVEALATALGIDTAASAGGPVFASERPWRAAQADREARLRALQAEHRAQSQRLRPYALARSILSAAPTRAGQALAPLLRAAGAQVEVADGFATPTLAFEFDGLSARLATPVGEGWPALAVAAHVGSPPQEAVEIDQRTWAALALDTRPRQSLAALLDPATRADTVARLNARLAAELDGA